jgi:quinol monooxygenase YgiN
MNQPNLETRCAKRPGDKNLAEESAQLAAMGGHFSILMNFVGVAVARRRPKLRARWEKQQEKVVSKFALYVPLEAKPGKEKEVADFLSSAVSLVNAETGTITWFAIQMGPSSFAIFDTFDDEAGRNAHLNGKVAAALMEKVKAGDLFAKTPEIHKLDILADKSPK